MAHGGRGSVLEWQKGFVGLLFNNQPKQEVNHVESQACEGAPDTLYFGQECRCCVRKILITMKSLRQMLTNIQCRQLHPGEDGGDGHRV